MQVTSIRNDYQDVEKQITNKETKIKIYDDTTDFPVRVGMLDNAKTGWEKDPLAWVGFGGSQGLLDYTK